MTRMIHVNQTQAIKEAACSVQTKNLMYLKPTWLETCHQNPATTAHVSGLSH